jgi:hypothetical protein
MQPFHDLVPSYRQAPSINITELPFTVSKNAQLNLQDPTFSYKANVLCNACRKTLATTRNLARQRGSTVAQRLTYSHGLSDLRLSATLGCHLCSILETGTLHTIRDGQLSPYVFKNDSEDIGYLFLDIGPSDDEQALCGLKLWHGNQYEEVGITSLRLYSTVSWPLRDIRNAVPESCPAPSLGRSTDDDDTFEVAEYWLRTCIREHDHGLPRKRSLSEDVPKRLLALGPGTRPEYVQVIDNTPDQVREYVCLSHRWGSQAHVPWQLRREEDKMRRLIQVSALSATFQDAIIIARRLGYNYLWIDCFCILQDSGEDFLAQSRQMSYIYAGSVFTIAALKSADSLGGCFTRQRNPLGARELHVEELDIHVERLNETRLWDLEVDSSGFHASPLHTRAWVVQERLSAPRTLYYGSMGIYWECRYTRASETHWDQPKNNRGREAKSMLQNLKERAEEIRQATQTQHTEIFASAEQAFDLEWAEVVRQYSSCALTRSTDKIPALLGIITEIQGLSSLEHVQGIWKHNLAQGLLWACVLPELLDRNPEPTSRLENGKPSWTWASVQCTIRHFIPSSPVEWQVPIEILDRSLALSTDKPQALKLNTWRRSVVIKYSWDVTDEYQSLALVKHKSYRGWPGDLQEEYTWWPDEKRSYADMMLCIILIQRVLISSMRSARCLVVADAGLTKGVYQRVGMVDIRFGDARDDPFPFTNHNVREDIILL